MVLNLLKKNKTMHSFMKPIFIAIFIQLFCLNFLFGSFLYSNRDTLSYGTDLNENLLIAAYNNDYHKVLVFITNGAKVNAISESGYTALMYAVGHQNLNMLKLLVSKGADIDVSPIYCCNPPPLIMASKLGYAEIVSYLLINKANTAIKDYIGASALHYAAFYNDTSITALLLSHGANVNAFNDDGETPLMLAAFNGSTEASDKLISGDAEINSTDKKGYTPLMMACQNGHYNVAVRLLQSWADINLLNKKGFSALSLAITNDYPEIVDLLLLNGANVNENNSLSLNPIAIARIYKENAIADSLKKFGAKRNYLPYFHNKGIGVTFRFNNKDFLMGVDLTFNDLKYNFESSLHYYFRPSAIAILQKNNDNGYYQFWERRNILGIGLTKNFFVLNKNNNALGINAGANYDFHFGKYRGTDIPISNGLLLSPSAGLVSRIKGWEFKLLYNYAKMDVIGLKNWYIGFSISIGSFKKPMLNKQLNLDL